MKSRWIITTVIAGALLSGCGKSGVEIGDVFVVKQAFIGTDTIKTYEEMRKDKIIKTDGETKYTMLEGQEVTVVGIIEEDEMVKVEITNGYDEETMWWTHKNILTRDAVQIDVEGDD